MTLAKRIRDCRYAKGWGPDELALRAEISRTALYQIERGKTETPRASTLRRIALALDVSIDALLGNAEWDLDAVATGDEGLTLPERPVPVVDHPAAETHYPPRVTMLNRDRDREVERKFLELLSSPLGDGMARIVEESYRLLPALRLA